MSGMPGWPCHPDASAGAAASETAAACEGRPRRRSRTSSTSCTKRSTPPPGCRRQPARRQQNPSAKTATRQSQPLHACTNPGVRQTCAIRASGLLAGPQRAATALAPIATEPGRHGLPKRHCGRDVPSGSTAVAHRAGGSPVECRLIWLPGRQPDQRSTSSNSPNLRFCHTPVARCLRVALRPASPAGHARNPPHANFPAQAFTQLAAETTVHGNRHLPYVIFGIEPVMAEQAATMGPSFPGRSARDQDMRLPQTVSRCGPAAAAPASPARRQT